METPVIAGEDLRQYVFERKLSSDPQERQQQEKNLRRIIILNGFRTAEADQELQQTDGIPVADSRYFPPKSTEPHYYHDGTLALSNPRGIIRLRRDINQVEALQTVLGREIELEVRHFGGDETHARDRFEENATKLTADIFAHLDADAVQKQGNLRFMMGPFRAIPPDMDMSHIGSNDYLNYMIGTDQTVFLDYIFADQADDILRKTYRAIDTHFPGLNVHIFHYGKVGVLNPTWDIGCVCLPENALEENKVRQGDRRLTPVYNELLLNDAQCQRFHEHVRQPLFRGTTVNTVSVLEQTLESLEHLRETEPKGDILEMEWAAIAGIEHGLSAKFPNIGPTHYYLAGIGSDMPLAGKNMGNTSYPKTIESDVVRGYLAIIEKMRSPTRPR